MTFSVQSELEKSLQDTSHAVLPLCVSLMAAFKNHNFLISLMDIVQIFTNFQFF